MMKAPGVKFGGFFSRTVRELGGSIRRPETGYRSNMTGQDAIQAVIDSRDLTETQAFAVASRIMAGELTPSQIAGLLVALRMKGETVPEITGFARAMRQRATKIDLQGDDLVDTCGTGGDGVGTFNISTVAAIVAASAGCKVAKHGNRSISSRCGSAEVLERLGVSIDLEPAQTARCITEIGVGFLFAPQYHQATRHAVAPRKEIGVRSIFNALGPLTNPAGAKRQLLGVYDGRLTEPMAQVLQQLGTIHCMVVHGHDGLDEITLTGETRVSELNDGKLRTFDLDPSALGFDRAAIDELAGGDPAVNAEITLEILRGDTGPRRDVVVLNSAAVIYVGGRAESLEDGVHAARDAIDSGRAMAKLEALRSVKKDADS